MNVQQQIGLLKAYAFVSSLVLVFIVLTGFSQVQQRTRFEEIDVERINIIEKDGKLKMVITNQERFPDAPMDGRVMKRRPDQKFPGILFFNSDGDESGGLTFRSSRLPDGVEANASLNFDQYKQDRTLQLLYGDYQGRRTAGLVVWDRPEIPLGQILDRMQAIQKMPEGPEKTELSNKLTADAAEMRRVFVGKTPDRSATVVLSDTRGRPRLLLAVDGAGTPKLEFLDETGKVIESLPARR